MNPITKVSGNDTARKNEAPEFVLFDFVAVLTELFVAEAKYDG